MTHIDVQFDEELANILARPESFNKHLYRPNTYLHKWWARRCGSTFRLILKHLVEDDAHRDYLTAGGLEGKVILDPMMGGGTTLHEAIRLEANVVGVDIDPIPVLQARATLTDVSLDDLTAAFNDLNQVLYSTLAPYFTTHCPTCQAETAVRFTLYGLRRSCHCGPAIVVDSLELRQERDGSIIYLCLGCQENDEWQNHPTHPSSFILHPSGERPPIVEKGQPACSRCGAVYGDDLTIPFYARYAPLVVVGRCPQHGLFHAAPTPFDLDCLRAADAQRPHLSFQPSPVVENGPKAADLLHRGIHSYADLFSSRQLLYLRQAIDLLPRYEPTLRLNLALLVSTSLEFNSMLCSYKGGGRRRPGAIRHTFAHHAYSFPYTALENNPLYPGKSSGTLTKLFHDRLYRARQWAVRPSERAMNNGRLHALPLPEERDSGVEVDRPADLQTSTHRFWLYQGSSAALPLEAASVDYVVTDPPYFDSVQYSDLSAFFRVWLRQMLPGEAQWEYDTESSAVGGRWAGDGKHYATLLGDIFGECRRVLRPGTGRLIFTFHHWRANAWAALTLALRRAGFHLVNRYVVHSENAISVHIAGLKALTHDAILVLAPRETGQGKSWSRPESIDNSNSKQFCADCAAGLGWLLAADLDEREVERQWKAWLR